MMKKSSKKIQIYLMLFVIIGVFPFQKTNAQSLVETLYTYDKPLPVIDGVFENSVWDTNEAIDVTLYSTTNQSDTMVVSLMAVYEKASENITFGFIIGDTTQGDDRFGIIVESNPANDLYEDSPWGFGGTHDLKIHFIQPNYGDDGYTFPNQFEGGADTSQGGVNHVTSKSTYAGNEYSIEMMTPLDSVELDTLDFSLSEDQQIGFTMIYLDNPTSTIYTQFRKKDLDWDYCKLVVGPKPSPTPTKAFSWKLTVIISLPVLAIITILTKRKNN
ncbi:MAG: hypothetical protein GF308_20095 [Candidatus Heimdallarchaeota archaeon]|nr:hypothetical protein [Candidatus Heimdallarchaeota archaeon]